jgi:hypothetical protein
MADPRYNMALMLSAQAFGEFVPPGRVEFFGRYRQEYKAFEDPLSPPRLTWGPRATLSRRSGPTLFSAVTHAYVFRAGGQINEVLIIGQRPPELERDIFQATLSCLLRVQAGDLDMLNVDTYRILAPGSDQTLLELPGISMLGAASTLTTPTDQTPADALSELVQRLQLLQEQTELVVVHDCDTRVKEEFDGQLRSHALEAFSAGTATIVAKDPQKSPGMVGWVTLVPYYQIARRAVPLRIVLHPDILNLPSFEELLDVFLYENVERIAADASVRQETYKKRADQLRQEQQRWSQASASMRKRLWDQSVLLTERFNVDTGTVMRLAQPIPRPTSVYMQENLPHLVASYEAWVEKMHKVVNDVQKAIGRSDTPMRRLFASRCLDAALRGLGQQFGELTIRKYFDRWCAQVTPFLRFRWRTLLESKGIDPQAVFTRHTVFHTRFQVDDQNEVIGLVMQPFTMVSPTHSVLIFDPDRPSLAVRDPSDYARAFDSSGMPSPNDLWRTLEQAAAAPGTGLEDFTALLGSTLSAAPFDLLPKVVENLAPPEQTEIDQQWREDQLLREQEELVVQTQLAAFPTQMTTALTQRAFHYARRLAHHAIVPYNCRPRLMLWQALLECLAYNQTPSEVISSLLQDDWQAGTLMPGVVVTQIRQLLREAKQQDPDLVQSWIELLRDSVDLSKAVQLLSRDWTRLDQYLSTPQRQALYKALSATDSAFLARQLETCAEAVAPEGEIASSVLAKIGQPLEDLLLTETGATPTSDVLALLEILVGEESRSY